MKNTFVEKARSYDLGGCNGRRELGKLSLGRVRTFQGGKTD